MARDNLYVRRQHGNDFFAGRDHALHAAAGGDIDEGIAVAYIVIAHVHHVGLGEEDDGVAIGVTGGKVQRANVFAIEMDGHIVIESDNGSAPLAAGFTSIAHRSAVARLTASLQALAHIVLRDDGGAAAGEGEDFLRCDRRGSAC